MSCPHGSGSPNRCSQCLGAEAKQVRKVVDGVYTVGDQIVDRTGLLQGTFQKQAGYGTVPTKNGKCTYCRKAGHAEADCRQKFNDLSAAAVKRTSPKKAS